MVGIDGLGDLARPIAHFRYRPLQPRCQGRRIALKTLTYKARRPVGVGGETEDGEYCPALCFVGGVVTGGGLACSSKLSCEVFVRSRTSGFPVTSPTNFFGGCGTTGSSNV